MASTRSAREQAGHDLVIRTLDAICDRVEVDVLVDALEGYLEEVAAKNRDAALIARLEGAVGRRATVLAYRATMHEMRSLMLAVATNLRVGRELLFEVLTRLAARKGAVAIQEVIELQDALDDAAAVSDQATHIAGEGLDASVAPSLSHAHLRDSVELAARIMSRGRGKGTPVTVVNVPNVLVRPSSGELLQVLLNLLRNAQDAVAHRERAYVTVDGWASTTMAFLRIADNGPGFPSTELDVTREGEIEPGLSILGGRGARGHGLGLYVCRGIVRRWGGTLEIADLDGGGARVIVGVPRQ